MMNPFTGNEMVILHGISDKYKWIARDRHGALFVYEKVPKRQEDYYNVIDDDIGYFRLEPFEEIFKGVTWEDGPVQFRKRGALMDDLISRQAAIDAVNNLTYPSSLVDVKRILVDLPSAQSE